MCGPRLICMPFHWCTYFWLFCDKVLLLLVASFWPSHTWFSDLISLLEKPPWRIPITDNLSHVCLLWHYSPEISRRWVWSVMDSGLSSDITEIILNARASSKLWSAIFLHPGAQNKEWIQFTAWWVQCWKFWIMSQMLLLNMFLLMAYIYEDTRLSFGSFMEQDSQSLSVLSSFHLGTDLWFWRLWQGLLLSW